MLDNLKSRFGSIKSGIIFSIVLFLLIFQAFFIYGLFSLYYSEGMALSEPLISLIQRTGSEEVAIKNIIEILELKDFNSKDIIVNRKFAENQMETIENKIIGFLDCDHNADLLKIIGQNKIMVSESYKFNALRNIVKSLREYVLICLEKKDVGKAISGFNSIISMVIFSKKGNEGVKVLIGGMISTALRNILCEVTAKLLESAKDNLTLDQLEKINQNFIKCIESTTDFFDILKGEMNVVKISFTNYSMSFYKNNFFKSLALLLALKSMDLYYGSAMDQYEEIMNKFISVKEKPYGEAHKKIKAVLDDFDTKTKSAFSILSSPIHPLVMIAVPNISRAFDQFTASKIKMNAILIRIALLKNLRSGGKTPLSINEVSTLPALSNGNDRTTDFFTGEKLKYSVSQTGEVSIYSCGPDMKDDGGKNDGSSCPANGFDIKL